MFVWYFDVCLVFAILFRNSDSQLLAVGQYSISIPVHMDLKQNQMLKSSKLSSRNDLPGILPLDQRLNMFSSQQSNSIGFSMIGSSERQTLQPQNHSLNDSANQCYGVRRGNTMPETPYTKFQQCLESPSVRLYNVDGDIKDMDQMDPRIRKSETDCDPQLLLSNLVFLEQKIHQLKDIVKAVIYDGSLLGQSNELVSKQQLVTADLSSIIFQLMSVAGSLLPSAKCGPFTGTDQVGASGFGSFTGSDMNNSWQNANLATGERNDLNRETLFGSSFNPQNVSMTGLVEGPIDVKFFEEANFGIDKKCKTQLDPNVLSLEEFESIDVGDHVGDLKEDEEDGGAENLPPGSFEVLQLEEDEILAPNAHFCTICGKGFKRDANLRMHMRGHGDEYKTPAALARPAKDTTPESAIVKRYSCPAVGCKRNKEHKKFQPLKSILCMKNHYKRSHCDKRYTCSKCNSKKFSVIADLKTHEKHCGRDKWLCTCGSTFSRKDKLFGHVALFQGHAPAISLDEAKGTGIIEQGETSDAIRNKGGVGFNGKEYFDHSYGDAGKLAVDQISMADFSFLKEDRIGESTTIRKLSQSESRVGGGSNSLLSFRSSNFMQENGGRSSLNGLQ